MNSLDEPIHPIGVVAERTGLTPDVLRVWERRYGVVDPDRASGGRRLYTEPEVERLGLLARLTSAGRSIGHIAHLETMELRRLLAQDEQQKKTREEVSPAAEHVIAAMAAVEDTDPIALERVLRRSVSLLGAMPFLEQVITPLFRRVGDAWHEGRLTVAQEHAATAVAERVLGSMRSTTSVRAGAPCLIVGTPEGDHHELGAMLIAIAAELEEWRVIYLGSNVPVAELVHTAVSFNARAVALSVTYVGTDGARADALHSLRDLLPRHIAVLAGGSGLAFAAPSDDAVQLPDAAALRDWLRTAAV